MRVALVHDWLTGMRGGERVLEVFLEHYPGAEIHTLIHVPGSVSAAIAGTRPRTSFVDRLPWSHRRGQVWLPLFPAAVESLELAGYDRVVSLSHCVAKGAIAPPGVPHMAYVFSPMRYAWDQREVYRKAVPAPLRPAWGLLLAGLRVWDHASAARPDRLVAISEHVRARIRRAWGRDAAVLPAPVDLAAFPTAAVGEGEYYLVLSALVPYKRIDLAVAAAPRLRYPVVVAGDGAEAGRLRAQARGNVRFLGRVPDRERPALMAGARALLFPGEEDFGLVPLEMNAVGRPVAGYGVGGLAETQVEGVTATFMAEQSVEALVDAVERLEAGRFDPARLRANAERFSIAAFRQGWARLEAELRG